MDSLATRDPIVIMARAACWNSEVRWRVAHGNGNYNCACRGVCADGVASELADMRAAIKALDEAGFAVVPKLVPRKRDCLDEPLAMGYARLVEQLRVKP